jgi:hypothetical protein
MTDVIGTCRIIGSATLAAAERRCDTLKGT